MKKELTRVKQKKAVELPLSKEEAKRVSGPVQAAEGEVLTLRGSKAEPLRAPLLLSDAGWLFFVLHINLSLLILFPSCPCLQVVREAAYVGTSKDVGKWQQVVLQNRRAEQLVFPLKQEIATVVPLEQVASAWKVGAVTCHATPRVWLGQLDISWLCWEKQGRREDGPACSRGSEQVHAELGKIEREVFCVPQT